MRVFLVRKRRIRHFLPLFRLFGPLRRHRLLLHSHFARESQQHDDLHLLVCCNNPINVQKAAMIHIIQSKPIQMNVTVQAM